MSKQSTLKLVKRAIQKQEETVEYLKPGAGNPQVARLIRDANERKEILKAVRASLEGTDLNLILYT